jgi:hypothetical protein
MPLIQVDLDRALFEEKGKQISDAIHAAQLEVPEMGIPATDKFQLFRPRDAGELVFDPGHGGVDRRSIVIIQITAVRRFPVRLKQALFEKIITRVAEVGLRTDDIFISFIENGFEDWKAGLPSAATS